MKTLSLLAVSTLLFAFGIGCSSSKAGSDEPNDAGGKGGSGGDASAPGDGGLGGNGDSGDGDSSLPPGDGDVEPDAEDAAADHTDPTVDVPNVDFGYDPPDAKEQDACVEETVEAEAVPLDIFFMIDRSSSMGTPSCPLSSPFTPVVGTKWCRSTNAIAGYLTSKSSAGNRAAIQYFPLVSGHSEANCNGDGYAVPGGKVGSITNGVGFGVLPGGVLPGSNSGSAATLVANLSVTKPLGNNTPTEGGLRGLVEYTKAQQVKGRAMIGILVTDGAANNCNSTDAELSKIPREHYVATGIHTFMIGMTGMNAQNFDSLEKWASYTGAISHPNVGGSCGNGKETCHHYNVGNADPTVFIDALKQIEKAVLSCTFKVPDPETGLKNTSKVNVDYSLDGGPLAQLTKRESLDACSGDGWYFDDPDNPQFINLCPETCTLVEADEKAVISIRLPCEIG